MSTQAIADFILKANENPGFVEKLEGRTADERIASLVAVGAERGFEFTAAEVQKFLDAPLDVQGELSEEQLALVAGGGGGGGIAGWVQRQIYKVLGPPPRQSTTDNTATGARG
jgi:predicted ribosomally synthesized peptide with nif11-like leader